MDINGFLTFLGLAIAAYAILPRERRLQLSIAVGSVERVVLLLFVLGPIQYLLLYPVFGHLGFDLRWFKHVLAGVGIGVSWISETPPPLSAGELAYVLLGILIIYVWLRNNHWRVGVRSITRLRELIEELQHQGEHAEVFKLFERSMARVVLFRMERHFLQRSRVRLKHWTYGSPIPFTERWAIAMQKRGVAVAEPDALIVRRRRLKAGSAYILNMPRRVLARGVLRATMMYEDAANTAADILLVTLRKDEFVTALARTRPYFGLSILGLETYERGDFADAYLTELIREPKSVLYFEIRHNENVASGFGYQLPESNRLLHFLFSRAEVANDLSAWRPIGDELLKELERLRSSPESDPYNHPMGDFYEDGKWHSPLWVGIRYFDIMVSSAIRQNVEWHMWLFYFFEFATRIELNFNPVARVDLTAEFPTRYSFLLYEMITAMRDWIKSLEHLPVDQANLQLESVAAEHENGNPVKSAIIALGQCMDVIVSSGRIPVGLKQYLVGGVFDLMIKLLAIPERARYGQVLLNSLIEAGGLGAENKERYLGTLLSCVIENDNIPHMMHRWAEVERSVSRMCREFLRVGDETRLGGYVSFNHEDGELVIFSRNRMRYVILRDDQGAPNRGNQ